jgi:hypothetical protein
MPWMPNDFDVDASKLVDDWLRSTNVVLSHYEMDLLTTAIATEMATVAIAACMDSSVAHAALKYLPSDPEKKKQEPLDKNLSVD